MLAHFNLIIVWKWVGEKIKNIIWMGFSGPEVIAFVA
jgi:hypothetical protein